MSELSDLAVSHYHITLKDVSIDHARAAAHLVKAKVTTIDLIRGDDRHMDRMLTKYQTGDSLNMLKEDVECLKAAGFTPSRYKLELIVSDLSLYLGRVSVANYVEAHVKVPASLERCEIKPFALSSNPKDMDHYFYNGRARTDEELIALIDGLEALSDYPAHREFTLFDSNAQHDAWWL